MSCVTASFVCERIMSSTVCCKQEQRQQHRNTPGAVAGLDARVPLNSCLFHMLPLHLGVSSVKVRPAHPPLFHGANCAFLSLAGDSQLCSALLFQAAVTACSAGGHVVYLCHSAPQCLPPHVHLMPAPQPDCMDLVQFVYLPTVDAMISYLSSVHRWNEPVSALLLDLSTPLVQAATYDHCAARLWKLEAVAREAALFLAEAREGATVTLIVADSCAPPPTVRQRRRVDRWPVLVRRGAAELNDSGVEGEVGTLVCTSGEDGGVTVLLHLTLRDSLITLSHVQCHSGAA